MTFRELTKLQEKLRNAVHTSAIIHTVDDRRWMTGDGSQETDHGRRMTINLLSYMKLRSCNRAQNCRHTMYRRHGSSEYDAKHYSEHYSEHYSKMPN
jgi:hypothetical protein